MFPSYEPVFVYVAKLGEGFVVHDAGETMAVVMAHGQDSRSAKSAIRSECKRYALRFGDRRISLKIDALDWLETAIVCVANASASAARHALQDTTSKSELDLADKLYAILESRVPKGLVSRSYAFQGASGRKYKFDLAVQSRDQLTLIETVTAHANSVNSKYVAFADVPASEHIQKIVAHNNDLSPEDILLLQNVAVVAGPDGVYDLVGSHARLQ